MSAFEFRILGPLEVVRDGAVLPLGGRQRALVAALALRANEVVPAEQLLDELFGSEPVSPNALQAVVSRLRRSLADDVVVTRSRGYELRTEPDLVDAARFEQLVEDGRRALEQSDAAAAAGILRHALSLWRGPPLADVEPREFAAPESRRLEELRLQALIDRVEADLSLGRAAEVIPELEALARAEPLNERIRGQLMIALYRVGRQSDALSVYRATRRTLHDQLGLEPSRALQELERKILVHDEELDQPISAVESGPVVCPFKGLAYFDRNDAGFFFGRERLVAQLVARLASAPVVGIIGASGAGKSSLLRAGVVPALAAGVLPTSEEWPLTVIRPGAHPAVELERALAPVEDVGRIVLAVDQLEEAFTICTDENERAAFFEALVDLAAERGARVIVALRADFYGACALYPRFAALLSGEHVLVGAMAREELLRAITLPATRAGLHVELALANALVADVAGEPGALPLLQTALLELWTVREGRMLDYASYRAAGGVQGAVARLAERAFAQLSEPERDAARSLLLRLSAGGDGTVRRRVPLSELDTEHGPTAAALGQLVAARLLTVDDGHVEVAHEALLREWPRLTGWLEDDHASRRVRAHLIQQAREWDESGRDAGELYRGTRLAAALEFATQHPDDVNPLERAFVQASQEAFERDRLRERRTARRLRILLAGAGTLLVAAVAAGVVAAVQRSDAAGSALAADAQRLGAQALVQSPLDRADLLARQAVALKDTVDTRSALLATLARSPAAIRAATATGDRVQWIDISRDGSTLAVGDNVGGAVLLDSRTLHRVAFLHLPGASYGDATSPDGRTLAIGGNSYVALVDVHTHRAAIHRLAPPWSSYAFLAYTPDGRHIFSAETNANTHGSRIAERDPRTFSLQRMVRLPAADYIGALDVTPDGRRLVATADTKGVMHVLIYDARSLRLQRELPAAGALVALSPDNRTAALGGLDGSLRFLDLNSGRTQLLQGRQPGMQGVRFAPDGRTVISVGDDQKLQIWDVASRTLRSSFSGHEGRVFGPAFSRDGRTVYTSGLDGTVIAWDLDGSRSLGRPFDVVTPRDPSIVPMSYLARAIAPDGRTIAVGTMNDTVELFDARTLRRERTITVFTPGQLRRLQRPPGDLSPGIIDSVAFGGDGRTIAAVGDAGVAELLDVRRGVAVRTLAHRSAFGWSNWVSSNRDGTRFAVSSDDGTVAVYTGNGRLLRLLRVTHSTPAHPVPIREAAFSPDGSRLAVARDGGTVDVWSLPDARRLWHRRIDRWTATTARFSPDARLIAAGGSQRGNVTLLDATTGRLVAPPFNTDAGYVVSAEFDPTGQLLATGGTDGAVRLWDVRTRKQYGADLPSRAPAAWSTATFYPDGRRLLGNWATGAAAVWDIDPADLARRACAVAGRTLTRAEWTSFLPGRPYRPACSASR